MPMLKQVATFDPPSYILLDGLDVYIDDEILDMYGNWEVVNSWEDYQGFAVFDIKSPINN